MGQSDTLQLRMYSSSEWLVCSFTFHCILELRIHDRFTVTSFSIIVISCAAVMFLSSSAVLDLLSVLSVIQGPFVLYQRLALIRSRCKHAISRFFANTSSLTSYTMFHSYSNIAKIEQIATLWREAVSLKKANQKMKTKTSIMRKDEERYVFKIYITDKHALLRCIAGSILIANFAPVDKIYRLELTLSPHKDTKMFDKYHEYRKIKEEQKVSAIFMYHNIKVKTVSNLWRIFPFSAFSGSNRTSKSINKHCEIWWGVQTSCWRK
jgi:hypothetical protein